MGKYTLEIVITNEKQTIICDVILTPQDNIEIGGSEPNIELVDASISTLQYLQRVLRAKEDRPREQNKLRN